MKAKIYNQKGKELETIELEDSVFSTEVNKKMLSQYMYVYLSNQRQYTANTKDRSEVSGGGRKPWRQKGTGRARVGSSRSPIWRKGGVVFGPTNDRNYKKTLTKNMRKAAMKSALSLLAQENLIRVVDTITIDEAKPLTKQASDLKKSFDTVKKVLVITADKNDNLVKAFSNLKKDEVEMVKNVNVYELLNGGTILIEKEAVNYLISALSKKQ